MIKVLIIEDEKHAYENLLRLLKQTGIELHVLNWLTSVEDSQQWLAAQPSPDLIFLDIQLSDGNSFSIFEHINVDCPVIFTTAYDEFALKAFELNSVDYLLKPLSQQKVSRALDKFVSTRGKLLNTALTANYRNLTKALDQLNNPTKLLVKSGNEFTRLPITNIRYLYSDDTVFCVADNDRAYSVKGSLLQIEKALDEQRFFKVNRKIVVNRSAIVSAKTILGGKIALNLVHTPDFPVLVSKERAKLFKQWFSG